MSTELIPKWEEKYAGRYAYELTGLEEAGGTYAIDDDQLEKGRLRLTLSWPLSRAVNVKLQVDFPDS